MNNSARFSVACYQLEEADKRPSAILVVGFVVHIVHSRTQAFEVLEVNQLTKHQRIQLEAEINVIFPEGLKVAVEDSADKTEPRQYIIIGAAGKKIALALQYWRMANPE